MEDSAEISSLSSISFAPVLGPTVVGDDEGPLLRGQPLLHGVFPNVIDAPAVERAEFLPGGLDRLSTEVDGTQVVQFQLSFRMQPIATVCIVPVAGWSVPGIRCRFDVRDERFR